jgi:hypothetical protein
MCIPAGSVRALQARWGRTGRPRWLAQLPRSVLLHRARQDSAAGSGLLEIVYGVNLVDALVAAGGIAVNLRGLAAGRDYRGTVGGAVSSPETVGLPGLPKMWLEGTRWPTATSAWPRPRAARAAARPKQLRDVIGAYASGAARIDGPDADREGPGDPGDTGGAMSGSRDPDHAIDEATFMSSRWSPDRQRVAPILDPAHPNENA